MDNNNNTIQDGNDPIQAETSLIPVAPENKIPNLPVLQGETFPPTTTTFAGIQWDITPKQWQAIALEYAKGEKTLVQCCQENGFKDHRAYHWAMNSFVELSTVHAHMRQARAGVLAERQHQIAMDKTGDVLYVESTDQHGNITEKPIPNNANVRRSELICKVLQWDAAKLDPNTYGDKSTIQVNQKSVSIGVQVTPDMIKNGSIDDLLAALG